MGNTGFRRSVAFFAGLVGVFVASIGPAVPRSITDSAGRVVEISDAIARVHAAGPPAATVLYTLAPQKMIGWLRPPRDSQKPFLLPEARTLPAVGRLTSRTDLDRLTVARPDLLIDFGAVNDNYRSLAARTQAETGIPYLLIDGSFANTPAALRLLGDVLGVRRRGEELARAAEAIYAEVDRLLGAVTRRPRVYFAGGQDGLQTGGDGSNIGEIIDRVGGINVAGGDGRGGKLSPEQVAAWAPDAILTFNRTFRDAVAKRPEWQPVPAVAAGRIFVSPDRLASFTSRRRSTG